MEDDKHSIKISTPSGPYCKTFYGRNLRISVISWSVSPLQTSPALSNVCEKAGAYLSEAPFRCSTLG
jgi:hypothetical protein